MFTYFFMYFPFYKLAQKATNLKRPKQAHSSRRVPIEEKSDLRRDGGSVVHST